MEKQNKYNYEHLYEYYRMRIKMLDDPDKIF